MPGSPWAPESARSGHVVLLSLSLSPDESWAWCYADELFPMRVPRP